VGFVYIYGGNMIKCHFCKYKVSEYPEKPFRPSSKYYLCPKCGYVKLNEETVDDFDRPPVFVPLFKLETGAYFSLQM
jgi:hypothetical protein